MAEDYGNIRQAPHGRGYYSGEYPVFKKEPNETAVAEFGKQIANIINGISQGYFAPLQRTMEGVKAGFVDPNEALVEGTPGGELFRKYFGVKPPGPVRDETVWTGSYNNPTDEVTAGEPLPLDRSQPPVQFEAKTGRKTGGFTPATLEQLQQHVIRENARGNKVPDELAALSGLLKTRSQQTLYNPQIQADLEHIKQDPKLFAEFMRARRYASDDTTDADIIGAMRAAKPSLFPDAGPSGTGGYRSAANYKTDTQADTAEKKVKSAEQIATDNNETKMKVAQLRTQAYTGTWDKRIAAQKELAQLSQSGLDRRQSAKIDAEADTARSKNYVSLVNHLSNHIGAENAHGVANEMIYGEGDWDNIPDSIRESAQTAFKKDQELVDAKIGNEKTKGADRAESLRQGRIRLEQSGMKFEENMRRWAMQDQHRAAVDQLRMNLRALEVMTKDPKSRATAALTGQKMLREWGVDATEPEGIFTMLTHMANAVGASVGFVSPEQAPKPFNMPTIIPPKQGTPPIVPKPSNYENESPQAKAFREKYAPKKPPAKGEQ